MCRSFSHILELEFYILHHGKIIATAKHMLRDNRSAGLIKEFSDKVKIVPTHLSDIENYTIIVQLNGKRSITFHNKNNKISYYLVVGQTKT